MIIVSRLLFAFMPSWVMGITIWPFIFLKYQVTDKRRSTLVNHERIHLRQQAECGYIGLILATMFNMVFGFAWYILAMGAGLFYILYIAEFLFGLAKYRDFIAAYKAISFEQEAYRYESDAVYLDRRPSFAFTSQHNMYEE